MRRLEPAPGAGAGAVASASVLPQSGSGRGRASSPPSGCLRSYKHKADTKSIVCIYASQNQVKMQLARSNPGKESEHRTYPN